MLTGLYREFIQVEIKNRARRRDAAVILTLDWNMKAWKGMINDNKGKDLGLALGL